MHYIQSNRVPHDRTCRFRKINKEGIRVAFEVTHKCNFKCKHCFIDRQEVELPLADILPILKQLKDINCRKIIITGGEPLIRKDLEKIIKECADQKFLVDLNTNLFLLNRERAHLLVDAGLNELSVSVYGNEYIHDEIVGVKGAYKKVIDNLQILRELNIDVDIHTAVFQKNIDCFDHVFDICEQLICSSLTFFTLIEHGCDLKQADIDKEKTLGLIRKKALNYNIPVNTIGFVDQQLEECTMCQAIVGITANLELKPCLLAAPVFAGNVYDIRNDLPLSINKLQADVKEGKWKINCVT